MYAKLKTNGTLEVAPRVLRIVVSNPTDERLRYEGFKPVIETPMPGFEDGYLAVPSYTDEGENIVQHWTIEPITEEEPIE